MPQKKNAYQDRLRLYGHQTTLTVQARFASESGKYSIYFERFGADIGEQNFELPPGHRSPKHMVWTMQLELSNGEAFWRLADGQTLKSPVLARRVVGRLREFHDEYGISFTFPGY